jgi:hypothetical protein
MNRKFYVVDILFKEIDKRCQWAVFAQLREFIFLQLCCTGLKSIEEKRLDQDCLAISGLFFSLLLVTDTQEK